MGDRSLLLRDAARFLLASDLAISSAWVMGFSGAVMAIILALVSAKAVGGHVAGTGDVEEHMAGARSVEEHVAGAGGVKDHVAGAGGVEDHVAGAGGVKEHVAGAGGVKEPLASCLTDKQVISLRVTAIIRDLSRTFSILHI